MEPIWSLQDAKNKFSEVVERAIHHGPQKVSRRNIPAVVVLSFHDYDTLRHKNKHLGDFFLKSPLHATPLNMDRSKNMPRQI